MKNFTTLNACQAPQINTSLATNDSTTLDACQAPQAQAPELTPMELFFKELDKHNELQALSKKELKPSKDLITALKNVNAKNLKETITTTTFVDFVKNPFYKANFLKFDEQTNTLIIDQKDTLVPLYRLCKLTDKQNKLDDINAFIDLCGYYLAQQADPTYKTTDNNVINALFRLKLYTKKENPNKTTLQDFFIHIMKDYKKVILTPKKLTQFLSTLNQFKTVDTLALNSNKSIQLGLYALLGDKSIDYKADYYKTVSKDLKDKTE